MQYNLILNILTYKKNYSLPLQTKNCVVERNSFNAFCLEYTDKATKYESIFQNKLINSNFKHIFITEPDANRFFLISCFTTNQRDAKVNEHL